MIILPITINEDGVYIQPDLPDGAVYTVANDLELKVYFADDQEYIDLDVLARTRKYARVVISKECGKKILAGFVSDASGSSELYRNNIEDQINIISLSSSSRGGSASNSSGSRSALTPSQVRTLSEDMIDAREALLIEKENRYAEIKVAATEQDIQAIINKAW